MLYLPFLNYAQGTLGSGQGHVGEPGQFARAFRWRRACGDDLRWLFPDHFADPLGARSIPRRHDSRLEFLIQRQCRDTAAWVGLKDRGVLASRAIAPIMNVIDFDQ